MKDECEAILDTTGISTLNSATYCLQGFGLECLFDKTSGWENLSVHFFRVKIVQDFDGKMNGVMDGKHAKALNNELFTPPWAENNVKPGQLNVVTAANIRSSQQQADLIAKSAPLKNTVEKEVVNCLNRAIKSFETEGDVNGGDTKFMLTHCDAVFGLLDKTIQDALVKTLGNDKVQNVRFLTKKESDERQKETYEYVIPRTLKILGAQFPLLALNLVARAHDGENSAVSPVACDCLECGVLFKIEEQKEAERKKAAAAVTQHGAAPAAATAAAGEGSEEVTGKKRKKFTGKKKKQDKKKKDKKAKVVKSKSEGGKKKK